MKFCHVMIRVKDAKKSLKFYETLFEMKVVKEMELEDCRLFFLSDEKSNVEIELTQNFETPANGYENGSAFGHFAFCVENFEKFEEKMQTLGLKWLYEPFMLEKYSMKIAFLKDPDGNEIEIIEEKV